MDIMTAQVLTSELSTLILESKRKHPELRNAAEKSLSDLKALPRTSEAQIAADLKSRTAFVKPFLLACGTRNPKFASSAVICLQRLIVANALPRETLEGVLEALRECSSLALDIQLKVLQALPSLLQNYGESLTGPLLVTSFQVCFLLHSSKTGVVSNTAAATLQQLVNATFDKLNDPNGPHLDGSTEVEVPTGDGLIRIGGITLDSYRILDDLCLMTDGHRPKDLLGASLSQNFGLELVGSLLTNHVDTIAAHPEHVEVLRIRLMPMVIKLLSEKVSFSSMVRVMRLLHVILSRLLFALSSECEVALSLLNHSLDFDAAIVWKRVLCLELFRSIHSEAALVRSIYAHYDEDEERRNIIRDHLSCIVRLAAEKPAIIGLGQQSSIPTVQIDDSGEQAAVQAGGLVGSIGASVNTIDINTPGISSKWSNLRVPCIEMLDKSEAPSIPSTYIYSLALNCITTFADGLARFLLPFTVPSDIRLKRRSTKIQDKDQSRQSGDSEGLTQTSQTVLTAPSKTLINPLNLKGHVLHAQIVTSASMVEQCWPALLAASSTYLNASLDSDYYHGLIRSFQKFAQVAGLLDLATPQDAFLTTLGKNAVPAGNSARPSKSMSFPSPVKDHNGGSNDVNGMTAIDDSAPKLPEKQPDAQGVDIPRMDTRRLLCLRALLNLGIALGPVLRNAWSIILETLQEVDHIIELSKSLQSVHSDLTKRQGSNTHKDPHDADDLTLEIAAADTAATRMFESTSELPNEAFRDHLRCLCALLPSDMFVSANNATPSMLSPTVSARKHQKLRSVSGGSTGAPVASRHDLFVFEKLEQVVASNVTRLAQLDTGGNGWDMLVRSLINVVRSRSAASELRISAAKLLDTVAFQVATAANIADVASEDAVRDRCLASILSIIRSLNKEPLNGSKAASQCEEMIHARALDSTRLILEQCGESLKLGWPNIFAIVKSAFPDSGGQSRSPTATKRSESALIIRSSFGSLQLICSDFLSCVPSSSLLQLLDTIGAFSEQPQDLNISLTSATFFRNISDFLLQASKHINLEDWATRAVDHETLTRSADAESRQVSIPALWLYLLLKLLDLTKDKRQEVRHSALHTLFGIFDACNEQMTPTAVQVCFEILLIKSLRLNQEAHGVLRSSNTEEKSINALNETAIVLIQGISRIFPQWLDLCAQRTSSDHMWSKLLQQMGEYLDRRALSISTAIFNCLDSMFAQLENSDKIGHEVLDQSWTLWLNADVTSMDEDSESREGNESCVLAYLGCLDHLLRFSKDHQAFEQIKNTISKLQVCITGSTAPPYSSDIDTVTPVQRKVLDILRVIPTTTTEAVMELLKCITAFVVLAYRPQTEELRTKQTYLALSKASMSLLESFIAHHVKNPGVDVSELVCDALVALRVPIRMKYRCQQQGKAPSPWRKATLAAVSIMITSKSIIMPGAKACDMLPSFWDALIDVITAIILADVNAINDPAMVREDQEADIEAFSKIRDIVIPALGSPLIPEAIRQRYAEVLMQGSTIHEFNVEDIAAPGQGLLDGLSSVHIGRVQSLSPSPRSQLAYLLLDEMFTLISSTDQSTHRINLARAIAPYFVLRVSLTLKAYVYDQPLRGRMPQPWSEKEEMLHILRKLIEVDSEPQAFPTGLGIQSDHKKHLHRFYPLLVRTLRSAQMDEEMTAAINDVLEAIGDDLNP